MKSDKVPYILAGSAVGGAAAFFLLTRRGRRMTGSVRNFDSRTIPDRMEEVRAGIERRAQAISNKIEGLQEKFNRSVNAGQRSYEESGQEFQVKLRKLEDYNGRCVAGIHKSIDEMNRTLYALEKTVMRPLGQVFAVVRAVQEGVKRLNSDNATKVKDNVNSMFDREHVAPF